jgi:hypothetical protein
MTAALPSASQRGFSGTCGFQVSLRLHEWYDGASGDGIPGSVDPNYVIAVAKSSSAPLLISTEMIWNLVFSVF